MKIVSASDANAHRITLDAPPLHILDIPMLEERNVRTGFFEHEQFDAIRDHLPATWQPVVTLAYYTGWRVRSEILPLTWAHVDLKAQILRLDAGTTKNTEGRTFPYGALAALKDVMRDQAAVREAFKTKGIITPWLCPDEQGDRLPACLAWLESIARGARSAAASGNFGVFGTSIAGVWLFGEVEGRVDFFLDEDRNRIGAQLFDRPILRPQDRPEGNLFVALAPAVARGVVTRLNADGRGGAILSPGPLG